MDGNDGPGELVALHRWAVIAEAANPGLAPAERGAVVRAIAAASHTHPDGSRRRYSRNTIDRWLRAWQAGGLAGLAPKQRCDSGGVRRDRELFDEAVALRLELPTRSAAAIADILWRHHQLRIPERTIAAHLRAAGCTAPPFRRTRKCSAAMRPKPLRARP